MTAGLILLASVWEFTDQRDESGGNAPSGTVIYEGVQLRMQNSRNSLDLRIQGYEVDKMFSATVHPRAGMNLYEKKHYFQITSPPNYKYYMKMFRVVSVGEPDFHPADPRRYLNIVLERSDLMHSENYQ